MNNVIYLIGAGGHARSLISLVSILDYRIEGIFDNSFNTNTSEVISNISLLGELKDISIEYKLVLAVGNNELRKSYYTKFLNQIIKENLIHPTGFVVKSVKIGLANQIFGNVFINSEVNIGDNNILNTGCIIEHESIIGSHNHISVGSILCGRVLIGDNCFIGAGSVVIDNIKICSDVVVGANSTVIKNITEPGIYIGNPARKIK